MHWPGTEGVPLLPTPTTTDDWFHAARNGIGNNGPPVQVVFYCEKGTLRSPNLGVWYIGQSKILNDQQVANGKQANAPQTVLLLENGMAAVEAAKGQSKSQFYLNDISSS